MYINKKKLKKAIMVSLVVSCVGLYSQPVSATVRVGDGASTAPATTTTGSDISYSVLIGNAATSADGQTGNNAIAIGSLLATSTGVESIAIGGQTEATANYAIATGYWAQAAGRGAIATGLGSSASGANSIAIGSSSASNVTLKIANASGTAAVALGTDTTASGTNSVALGTSSTAAGTDGVAIGYNSKVSGANESVILGVGSTVASTGTITYGTDAVVGDANTITNASKIGMLGWSNTVTGSSSSNIVNQNTIVGQKNNVYGTFEQSLVLGNGNNFGTAAVSDDTEDSVIAGVANTFYGKQDASMVLGNSNYITSGTSSYIIGSNNILNSTSAVSIIGGYSEADNSLSSSMTGIANTMQNTAGSSIIGINNKISLDSGTYASSTLKYLNQGLDLDSIIGVGNTISGTSELNTIIGANNTLSGASTKNSVLGFSNNLGTNLTADQIIASGGTVSANTKSGVLIGQGGTVGGNNAIAVGTGTKATSNNTIAIGSNDDQNTSTSSSKGTAGSLTYTSGTSGTSTTASLANDIAIGTSAQATGTTDGAAIAIGYKSQATGDSSISIGTGNIVSGANSGAFGDPNKVTGSGSYAIGNNNTVANNNTFVLGNSVTTSQDNSVVLGNASTDKAAVGVSGITINDKYYSFAGTSPVGVVSVGSVDGERQIINVAAGEISSDSTDAINGSQLYAVESAINGEIDQGLTFAGNTGSDTVQLGKKVTVKGSDAATGTTYSPSNITTEESSDTDGNSTILIEMSTTPTFDSVTAGTGANQVIISSGGVSVGGKTYIDSNGLNANNQTITNVKTGVNDTDAVNVSQLKSAVTSSTTTVTSGDSNVVVTQTSSSPNAYTVALNPDEKLGTDSNSVEMNGNTGTITAGSGTNKVTMNGSNGTITTGTVSINGSSGSTANANEANTIDGLSNTTWSGTSTPGYEAGRAATEGELNDVSNQINNITTADGYTFAGDSGSYKSTLGSTVNVKGDGKNISTAVTNGTITVSMSDTPTFTSVTTGNTVMNTNGVTITNGPSMTTSGIDAGSKQITNVAAGTISSTSTDAVNGSQLYGVEQNVVNQGNQINKLGDRVDKVGAGAAALAGLHPLDFDPDDKWDFAMGYGHYDGQGAVASGMFYRPDEDTMFSFGYEAGNGENMWNAGVTLKLGSGNHVSTSRVAMAKEIVDLRSQNTVMQKEIQQLNDRLNAVLGTIDTTKSAEFPDVPENHWAYEYVAKLAGNGIIKGYPDGTFQGDRTMTRYEFAAMLYRAMQNGATIDGKLLAEFKPELDRISVDTISSKSDGTPTIQRVRVIPGRG